MSVAKDNMHFRERLIVALDIPDFDQAVRFVKEMGESVCFYKIGLQLLVSRGLELVEWLHSQKKHVFLDYKLYDIPDQVEKAVRMLSLLGARMVTVHADIDVMKAAVAGRGTSDLCIFAVTVLTSVDHNSLQNSGIIMPLHDLVCQRAGFAEQCGCDGVIASGHEATMIKQRFQLSVVSPGIRPVGISSHEQKRVVTPGQAIAAGSDYIVVGRAITRADDPLAMVTHIVNDMASAQY